VWRWWRVTLHVQVCSDRNRIIPLIRLRPNTDSASNKPVTLPRNQLLLRYVVTSPVHTATIRYAVTLQVCTHINANVQSIAGTCLLPTIRLSYCIWAEVKCDWLIISLRCSKRTGGDVHLIDSLFDADRFHALVVKRSVSIYDREALNRLEVTQIIHYTIQTSYTNWRWI